MCYRIGSNGGAMRKKRELLKEYEAQASIRYAIQTSHYLHRSFKYIVFPRRVVLQRTRFNTVNGWKGYCTLGHPLTISTSSTLGLIKLQAT